MTSKCTREYLETRYILSHRYDFILNVKSPHTAKKLNDPDRRVTRDIDDDRFPFLENMACMFEKMDPASSRYPGRVMCLTSQTSQALSVTLRGVVEVTKTLLRNGVDYVMTGDLNDERLEGEFGIYRGSNGGDYYMSGDQVQNALKLQRLKLFASLEEDIILEHTERDCCKQEISDGDLILLDDCFDNASDISVKEKSSLYYISGYICHKENLPAAEAPTIELPESDIQYRIERALKGFYLHSTTYMKALIVNLITFHLFFDVLLTHFRKDS